VLSIAVNEQLDLIFSGGADNAIILWRLSTGARILSLTHIHDDSVLSMACTFKYLVSGSKDRTAKVWNIVQSPTTLANPRPDNIGTNLEARLLGHTGAVNAVLIRADEFVITGSGDRVIRIWETGSWACVRSISGQHTKGIATLALSLDGMRVVSGSSDTTIRIFDIQTGVEEGCLEGHMALVRSVCVFAGKGVLEGEELICSGGYDEQVYVWAKVKGTEGKEKWEIVKRFTTRDGVRYAKWENGTAKAFNVMCDEKKVYCANETNVVCGWELSDY